MKLSKSHKREDVHLPRASSVQVLIRPQTYTKISQLAGTCHEKMLCFTKLYDAQGNQVGKLDS